MLSPLHTGVVVSGFAWARSADQDAARVVDPDRLRGTERVCRTRYMVAEAAQFLRNGLWHRAFQLEGVVSSG